MSEGIVPIQRLFQGGDFPADAFFIDRVLRGRPIVVYGAGESFHYFKEVVMKQYGYHPRVVLDRRFKPGDTFEGAPAFPPETYTPSAEEREQALVVVCLGRQSYFDEVVLTLRRMGFQHILRLMDIYEIHNPFGLPEELQRDGFAYFVRQRERVETAFGLMGDELSREVYMRCLQTHLRRTPVPIPMSERHEQYVPKDVPLTKGFQRFLYCGISVGEVAHVMNAVGPLEEVAFFEPDPNQFRLLADHLAIHARAYARRVTALPCAVYDREGLRPFRHSETSFGSRILAGGNGQVQVVSIDRILPGFRPTFLNMDIEGAELEALKGAERTLQEARPDLAICVYHAPHHLWELPLYLHKLGIGYRFYLRNYTSLTSETVLYATAPTGTS